jgi:hypothetical protein
MAVALPPWSPLSTAPPSADEPAEFPLKVDFDNVAVPVSVFVVVAV